MTDRLVFLQIPGPTNVPPRVLEAISRPLINHRGPEFEAFLRDCVAGLKRVYKTNSDVIIFPGSGSGGLEAAIVNTLSPGDRVLSVQHGVFSERFGIIAAAHGAEVERLTELLGILSVLESSLAGLGYRVDPGSAVRGFLRATEM